jgi:hypothetical protein
MGAGDEMTHLDCDLIEIGCFENAESLTFTQKELTHMLVENGEKAEEEVKKFLQRETGKK